MKFATLAATATAVLASGALAQDPPVATEMWFAFIALTDDQTARESWVADLIDDAAYNWNEDHSPKSLADFKVLEDSFEKCVIATSVIEAVYADVDTLLSDATIKGVSAADRKTCNDKIAALTKDGKNPYIEATEGNVIKLIQNLYSQYLKKNTVGQRVWWTTTPELMKDPTCTKEKLAEAFSSNVTKFEKVKLSSKQFDACVEEDSTGALTPICTDTTDAEEQKKIDACVACSMNNGMVASAIGAAALVALGLFF